MTPFGKLIFGGFFLVCTAFGYVALTKSYEISSSFVDEGGAIASVAESSSTSSSSPLQGTTMDSATSTAAGAKESFAIFVRRSGTYSCRVDTEFSGVSRSGEIIFNDTRIRGSFVLEEDSSLSEFIVISKDLYSWVTTATGTVATDGLEGELVKSASSSLSETFPYYVTNFNFAEVSAYDCVEKDIDVGQFALPSSVSFSSRL